MPGGGGRRPCPVICSWEFWFAVVGLGNASSMPSLLTLAMSGSELPPLRDNLPPLELRNNQPPVGRPPLEVVLLPLGGELFGGLLVMLVLCCVVPSLLQSPVLPQLFL